MTLLAISGSLLAASSNTRLLQALALTAAGATVDFYDGLADLPHFNPDLDVNPALPAVAKFREQLRRADAIVFCTPEYARGVPGSLKNALDWIVSSGEFVEKPVALINASAHATHAHESLAETLRMLLAAIACEVIIPLQGSKLTPNEIAASAEFAPALRGAIETLMKTGPTALPRSSSPE